MTKGDDILHEIRGLRTEMTSRFNSVDERFNSVDEAFNAVGVRIDGLHSRVDTVIDALADLRSDVDRHTHDDQ